VGKSLATFQKSKSTWATVGSTSLPLAQAGPSRTTEESNMDEDIKPDMEAVQKEEKKQLTKRKGGLRTAAQIREEAEQLKAERAAALAAEAEKGESSGQGQQGPGETVHRDSSGRIVDVEKLKREAKEKAEEEKRKAREREEWSKGMVQRQGREDRARQEREMGETDVAR
jgi:pre-mRNA-splicing factor CWC26